jgi:tetratricopeptide (TPR) repeat protein
MTTPLNSAIVRIRAANGTVVGTGFLVTGRHVLTCVHVVTAALGLPHHTPNPPQADLHLDFPLLAPESTLTAHVSHWQPAIDVAVLELTTDPPAESKPVRLVTADDLWGHSFRALGFPAGYEQGVWASGVLRGQQADGWLQIEDTKETGYLIAPGFSGGPVWDDVLGGVVGMIVAADTDERVKAAFLIPADVLAEALPNLVRAYVEWAQAQLDADMDQLRTRRDQADEARREMRERQRVVNLRPLDVTHTFKDRLREVQALCDHLTDSSVRLVSVVGRGGMGKTALVSRVLGDLEQGVLSALGEKKELPIDGILYLSARSTSLGLERIYADVGRMLGEPAASKLEARWADGSMPLVAKVEYLLEAMHDGLYLILLDNLESVMAEDGTIKEGLRLFVERCLTQPSGVRLIATSREQVRVTAAALHTTRSIPLREGLPEDEAVALLRDLDPQGTLGLRDAPEENLRRAAGLTQSIPRALEILAGILHEDPTASLPRLLADENLFGEQVVEQLVATGYSRLGEAERRVIEALAIFDQPVEETSVAYLLHPWWPGLDVRARLHRLVRGYFVSVNRVTGRYSLHPLDREYAYRQIPDVADEEPNSYNRRNLELRAADFYARLRKPEGEWQTIDDLKPQLAEFEHRVRGGDHNGACQVLEPIDYDYLFKWGYYARVVELRESLLQKLTDPSLQITNLGRLGNACSAMGQVEWAVSLYENAVAIARDIRERWSESVWLSRLGNVYRVLGQIERAADLQEQALIIDREIGERTGEGWHLGNLGHAYLDLGQVEQALNLYEQSLAIAREINDRWMVGSRLRDLGKVYLRLGHVKRAVEFYEQALVVARETCYSWGQSNSLLGLGRTLLSNGKPVETQRRCLEALDLNVEANTYEIMFVLGVALVHLHDSTARDAFADASVRCRAMLDRTAGLYDIRYILAASLVGQAICDPLWTDATQRAGLLAPALTEYRHALDITSAPGIVQDAIRDLALIRAAGIEGLEPVFELLENAEYKPDKDLADILEEMG